jgi:tRNA A-37 threonylcarbamoyl transferase component Bud32
MQTIEYMSKWQTWLEQAGLTSFDDYFALSGKLFTANKKRDVISFCIDEAGQAKTLFVKRFHHPHVKDMIFAAHMTGQASTQAQLEWTNVGMLLQHGIETYHPVALGQETRLGIERRSFLITEEIPGTCLTDFIGQSWHQLSDQEREQLMASLGKLARRVHDLGLSFPDLYVWHVFLMNSQGQEQDLALIDLHRMQNSVRTWGNRLNNLGALDYSMREEYFSSELKQIVWDSYMGQGFVMSRQKLMAKIKRRSKTLRARRRLPKY